MGQARGLRQYGINVNELQNAQEALNKALQRGQLIFDNLDLDTTSRSVQILKTHIQNLTKHLVQMFLPAATKSIQFITKNLKIIAGLIVGGAIFTGLKAIQKI